MSFDLNLSGWLHPNHPATLRRQLWILARPPVTVEQAAVVTCEPDTFASDHFPVTATVWF
jgi:endonuclease/exonuclease/phosphatase family metal-dependent hydrolase